MIRPCPDELRDRVLEALSARFGIPRDLLADRTFHAMGDDRVLLGPGDVPDEVDATTGGLLVARVHADVKPSTDFLQVYGDHVTENVVEVDADRARRFIAGQDLPRGEVEADAASRGWVLVRWEEVPLGCGFLREDRVDNVVPKGRRLDLDRL